MDLGNAVDTKQSSEYSELISQISFRMTCSSSLNADSVLEFYPPKLWGLDYHFHVYNKMYVQDILEMEEYPHFTGAFSYRNHPIYKVDVLGVVVKKVENSKCFIYAVDDGTGVILCCCWKDNFYNHTDPWSSVNDLPSVLKEKVNEIQAYAVEAEEGYSLGDLIQIKGKLKIFRDKKEVVANIHKKVTDPQVQVFRMCELPRLYDQQYDRPFKLPYKVMQAFAQHRLESETGTTLETALVKELKTVIFDFISKNTLMVDLSLSDLQKYTKVKDIFSKRESSQDNGMEKEQALLYEALSLLEEEGHVTRRSDRRMLFEVLLHKSKMERTIMTILATDKTKPKYAEKGCHYLHILDELHKTLPYSKVKKEALMFCLQKLEAQSDVIRTTHAHYLPCGD